MKIFIRMSSVAAGCFPLQNRTYLSTCMHLKAIAHYNAQCSERRPANKEKERGDHGRKAGTLPEERYLPTMVSERYVWSEAVAAQAAIPVCL